MNIDKARVIFAWVLLIGSLIAWPVTQATVARDEPPFTLALSWFAITLTAFDVLSTSQVKDKQK